MVTPRNQRYKRKVNSALDLSKMAAANDPKQAYEKRTKDYFRPKSGMGFLNDINLGAFVRFGKENLATQLKGLATFSSAPSMVGAKDRYGQSQSLLETMGPNSLENLIFPAPNRTIKSGINDVKNLAYFVGKLSPYMFGLDVIEYGNKANLKYVEEMTKRYAKLPKGPTSAYRRILDKFKG